MPALFEKQKNEKVRRVLIFITLLLSLSVFSSTLAQGKLLKTFETAPTVAAGSYTLFLYGCSYHDDVENVAILDREGDPYTLELFTPDFRYKVKTGLSAEQALAEAEQFVTCGPYYQMTQFSAISDRAGKVIGYEVRPLYSPIRFGTYNVLDIQYADNGAKVVVYIRLDPDIERAIENDGDRHDQSGN